ncbi:hypothetical protein J4Q44_G00228930 [Coregonus suidteri]|uniref:Uncharacterized protein n=1 Tax=Coregonus suidteri TaxID=861788 RepID=A0AAN8L6X5_9TELE
MKRLMPGFDVLISQVRKTAGFYVTTFALFIYHVVFDENLKCLCKNGVKPEVTYNQCHIYMVLPALILFLLTLWMDGQFQRILRITFRCRCRCNLWGRLLAILIKAAAIGLLWVVSVLLDGDWYVCYQRTELPCKNNTDVKPYKEELEKQLETHFKRESMVYGLVLVLVLLFATSILTAIPWRDICSILTAIPWRDICSRCSKCNCSNCCRMDCKIKPYHRALFEENIREQTEILIGNDFKTTAKECVVLESRKLLQPSSTAVLSDTTTQGRGGASSSSTRPEVKDRVITLDNLDFNKISDLDSCIISSLFPEPPSSSDPLPINQGQEMIDKP